MVFPHQKGCAEVLKAFLVIGEQGDRGGITSCFLTQMLHHIPHKPPKQQSAVTKEATPFLFLFLRLPQVTQAPHCLHRLTCIPDVGAAELLPEMRTALAGWGGIEGLSPDGPLTPHCSSCLGKAVWSFSSTPQSTAAPWNPAWLWECP